MSFLGDLIGSIGGERPPAPPLQSIRPPSKLAGNNLPSQATVPKSLPSTSSATSRPVYKGTAGLGAPQQSGSLKRKAEEISSERPVKLTRTNLPGVSDLVVQKPSKLNSNNSIPTATSKFQNEPSPQPAQNAIRPPAKLPTRGSYAALMAKAKDAQSTKGPSSIGLIKHQSTEKDKVKTSKLAERKRQDQDKDKEKDKGRPSATKQASKTGAIGKVDLRRRSASPVKKVNGPKLPQAPKPPLHGPRKEIASAYRGTMGQMSKKTKEDVRTKDKSRYNEYLSTDEDEDDDERYGYDDEPNEYYSDASSDDMEAGLDDMDMEERVADRIAKQEDAAELALEIKLKREKEERKRKLAAMAKKHSK